MKKAFLLYSLVLFVHSTNAQIISFSDPLFKAKLLESSSSNFIARNLNGDYFSIDANSNAEIEIAEAMQVGFLEIQNASITSIAEVQQFANLTLLHCENNLLTALNVSGLSNLMVLDCSNNQLSNLNVTGLTALQNLNCQYNQLTTLNVSGISNLLNLNCSYNQLGLLNLNNLLNLEVLNCNDNVIPTFDLSDLISLKSLDCSNNQLLALNLVNVANLETLNCYSNLIATLTIENLVNFNDLNCSNNQLTTLNLINLSSLINLNCNFNQLAFINFNNLINLKTFSCTNNQLSTLNLSGLTQLEDLNCANNMISTINFIGLNNLMSFNCNANQLANLDVSNLTNLKYLYCDYNAIVALNINGLNQLLVISCTNNLIANLSLSATNNLQSLYCSYNQISTLNLSTLTHFQNLFCNNNQLTNLFVKNGIFENNLQFSGNPNLEFICADESEIDFIQDEITNNNYTNCHVNSYCSFAPGGLVYAIQGDVKFDENNNGCDVLDTVYPNLMLSFSDGTIAESLISNTSGGYFKSLKSGSYTITPKLENANYFSIFPTTVLVNLPQASNPSLQDFCVTANGNHSDLEVAIFPLNHAIPNQEAKYKMVYKNKGTITQTGTVSLNFNDAVLELLHSNPTISSQSVNNLNWSFTNLKPLESRSILITLKVNASSDTPPVNAGQLLPFIASVATSNIDEFPNDNTITLNQKVVNNAIAIEKFCMEGDRVSATEIGAFLHYGIRFKNTGTATAQNIVVKDIIDTTKYDISTLLVLDGSHLFETRLTGLNTVEFIFQNINLAFGTTDSSEDYILFKIRTLSTLTVGDTFSNTAFIYFDYNAALPTNTATTTIETLSNQTFDSSENVKVYPNPVKEVLNLYTTGLYPVDAISIFNSLGQLIKIIANPNDSSIDVSGLKPGVYFINISTVNGVTSVKFIKA
jgi:Leucine-rich repeat (LRR) protein